MWAQPHQATPPKKKALQGDDIADMVTLPWVSANPLYRNSMPTSWPSGVIVVEADRAENNCKFSNIKRHTRATCIVFRTLRSTRIRRYSPQNAKMIEMKLCIKKSPTV